MHRNQAETVLRNGAQGGEPVTKNKVETRVQEQAGTRERDQLSGRCVFITRNITDNFNVYGGWSVNKSWSRVLGNTEQRENILYGKA